MKLNILKRIESAYRKLCTQIVKPKIVLVKNSGWDKRACCHRNRGAKKEDYFGLVQRMEENGFVYEYLNEKPDLFEFLI
jgi:hypothetical protein